MINPATLGGVVPPLAAPLSIFSLGLSQGYGGSASSSSGSLERRFVQCLIHAGRGGDRRRRVQFGYRRRSKAPQEYPHLDLGMIWV
jgi:hypothetical protein